MTGLLSIVFSICILISSINVFAQEAKKPESVSAPVVATSSETTSVSVPASAGQGESVSAPAAPKIDTGDTAWMIVATAFVMLMTLPGLALFYGGIAKKKDTLNTIAMSFVAFCVVSILWILYGFSLAFNGDISGFIGDTGKFMLNTVTTKSISALAATIPENIFVVFQLTFAAITVALASGAYIERMKFSAWLLFIALWFTIVYVPIAHWVWGGGFLAKMGALDFAGGTVVHINAGVAALVGAIMLGKRREMNLHPNSLPMVVTGAGLLWFGWFGFNAGSALAANGLAGTAFLNTNTAAAAAALAWMFTEWAYSKKPTILGLASGAVAGLVAITPAAGFVNLTGALIIGFLSGIIPFFAVVLLKPKLGYDDTLDAFGIHGVAGAIGAVLTGVFADPSINETAKGLLYGNAGQLMTQIIASGVTAVYCAIATFIIFIIIKAIIGLRVDLEDEITGLDESQHGQKAYN